MKLLLTILTMLSLCGCEKQQQPSISNKVDSEIQTVKQVLTKKHPFTPKALPPDKQAEFDKWIGIFQIYKCDKTGKYEIWALCGNKNYSKEFIASDDFQVLYNEFDTIELARQARTNRAIQQATFVMPAQGLRKVQEPCGDKVQ